MKQNQVETLIRAHYARDEERFASTVRQIAAEMRSAASRNGLLRWIESGQPRALRTLPHDAQSVLLPVEGPPLAELILAAGVQHELRAVETEHRRRAELAEHGLSPRSRLLFSGPPGNGKTSAAGALARELGKRSFMLSIPATVDSHMGETSRRLAGAFESLLDDDVAIILDELDALGQARSGNGSPAEKEYNSILAVLLTEFDRRRSGIIVATTNRVDILDPALRRRFDIELEFGPPGDEAKRELVAQLWRTYRLPSRIAPSPNGEPSFDAVAKMTMRAARDAVLSGNG